MTGLPISADSEGVVWIKGSPKERPLCEVPWMGRALVLSNGDVNFCCYTDAIVGNVNEQPFEEIWRGKAMERIRSELTQRRLPPECQSTSCPFYRGDTLHYLVNRGHASTRLYDGRRNDNMSDSALRLERHHLKAGDTVELHVRLQCRGGPFSSDLFIALEQPNGLCRFLPDYEEYAVPFCSDVVLQEDVATEVDARGRVAGPGKYRICAALFEAASDPNQIANCYWSHIETVIVA